MSGHTPGPWVWMSHKDDAKRYQVRGPDDAGPTAYAVCENARHANAVLIAAAPDLLAACKVLVESLTWEEKRSGTTYNGIEEARAAITRAESR